MLIPAVQPDHVLAGLANLTTKYTQQLITPIVSFGSPACAGTGLRFDRMNYSAEFLPISYKVNRPPGQRQRGKGIYGRRAVLH